MPTVDNNFYKDIGTALEQSYKGRVHQYLYSQNYVRDNAEHPFYPILPLTDNFFGPKNLTLLIVSKRYTLPNVPASVALNTIKNLYSKWSKFQVYIWVDLVLAQRILDESDDDTYYNDMVSMSEQLELICTDMTDYGFVWKGTLTEGKDASYFKPYIDDFYSS